MQDYSTETFRVTVQVKNIAFKILFILLYI